jgi:hypothetical protein
LNKVLTARPGRIGVAPRPESWRQQGPYSGPLSSAKKHLTEIIDLFYPNVSSICSDETILPSDETIFRFRSRHPETAIGYPVTNEAAHSAAT